MTIFLLRLLQENWFLLAIPLSAAIIGHATGRLLREREEAERPHQSVKN